jgi:hypothetical protein
MFQMRRAAIIQTIDHFAGTASVIIIDLAARSFDVAVMEKQVEPTQCLLSASTDQGENLRGTQKAVPVDLPDNVAIPVRQLNRWNFPRTLEAWPTSLGHAGIVANFGLANASTS